METLNTLAQDLMACANEQYHLAHEAAKTKVTDHVVETFAEIQTEYRRTHSLPDPAYPKDFTFGKALLSSVLPEHLLTTLLNELGFTNLKHDYLSNPTRLNYISCKIPHPTENADLSVAQQLFLDHVSAMEQIRKDNLASDIKRISEVYPDAIPFAQDVLERLRQRAFSRIEVPNTSGLITLIFVFTTPKSLSSLNWSKTKELNLFLQNYLENEGITKDQGFTKVSCELYNSETTFSITVKLCATHMASK